MPRIDLAALQRRLAQQQSKDSTPVTGRAAVVEHAHCACLEEARAQADPARCHAGGAANTHAAATSPTPPPLPPAARAEEAQRAEAADVQSERPPDARAQTARPAFPPHAPADEATREHNRRMEERRGTARREQSREAQELRRARSDALLLELRTRWPALFTTPVPLAIGIDGEIRDTLRQEAAAAGTAAPSWSVLKNTMAWWTKHTATARHLQPRRTASAWMGSRPARSPTAIGTRTRAAGGKAGRARLRPRVTAVLPPEPTAPA